MTDKYIMFSNNTYGFTNGVKYRINKIEDEYYIVNGVSVPKYMEYVNYIIGDIITKLDNR